MPPETATDVIGSDASFEVATDHDNTSDCIALESRLPISNSVLEASRPCVSETELVRRLSRHVRLLAKLKNFEVSINCNKVKYPLSC